MNDAGVINTLADRPMPGMGHNQPPLPELLADELAPDTKRAAELIAAAESSQIASDDDAEKVTVLIGLIRNTEKALDQSREQRKRPFLENCRIVDAAYGAVIRPLVLARAGADGRGGLGAMLTAWERKREAEAARERQRLDAERQQQEEAAARAREAAEAAKQHGTGSVAAELDAIRAQETADQLARQAETIRPEIIRTAVGASTMRREIAFALTDEKKAIAWLYKNRRGEIIQAARTIIGAHLRSMGVDAAEHADIPGVQVTIEKRAQVR